MESEDIQNLDTTVYDVRQRTLRRPRMERRIQYLQRMYDSPRQLDLDDFRR
jgi:hypothetical protein